MRFETYAYMKRHPIASDYAAGAEAVLRRFDAENPYSDEHRVWAERSAWLDRSERPQAERGQIADAVLSYNRVHNNVPEAIAAAERLRDPRALAVIGGQQAGLFTGPMLVIYKAITILNTAKRAEAALGRPVVPVFWIAGEDHDWDEVNHTFVVTPQLDVVKLTVAHPHTDKRTSVSRTELTGEAWTEALSALSDALPDTEFKAGIMDELKRIASEASTLSAAFAKTISLLFGKHGLVLVDSDDPLLRAVEGTMFTELVRRRGELASALKSGEQAVTSAGYPLQAEAAENGFQLFMFHDGERKLLYADGEDAVDRKGTLRIPRGELERLALEEPALLSNNALTRPLMQDYLFPTLAAVLGPSEIAYWSTLKEAFHLFGMRTPVVVPRQEFTLLEGTVQKQMDKFGLTFADAWEQFEERRNQWLREQDSLGLTDRFTAVKESFTEQYQPLVDAAASINPGLRKLGETNLGKIMEQIDFLEKRATDAMKQQHEAGLRHWERIRLTIAPNGKPQERVVNVFQYLNRYGVAWLDTVVEAAELDFSTGYKPHEVIYL